MCKFCSSTQIMRDIALISRKIYTAGTNFTRPPVVMVATNLNPGSDLIFISPTGSLFRFRSLVAHSWVLLFNWGNEARVPLLTQSILFPLFSDAIVDCTFNSYFRVFVMGYGIWDMGYGIVFGRLLNWDNEARVALLTQQGFLFSFLTLWWCFHIIC